MNGGNLGYFIQAFKSMNWIEKLFIYLLKEFFFSKLKFSTQKWPIWKQSRSFINYWWANLFLFLMKIKLKIKEEKKNSTKKSDWFLEWIHFILRWNLKTN